MHQGNSSKFEYDYVKAVPLGSGRGVKFISNNIVGAIPDGHIQTLNKCSWRNGKSVDIDKDLKND